MYVQLKKVVNDGDWKRAEAYLDRFLKERAKRQKEKFLIFTRVLMKYLDLKDPPLHLKVKAIIKECAELNRNKEPGYESVTGKVQLRIRCYSIWVAC
jgi:hypothetical protein